VATADEKKKARLGIRAMNDAKKTLQMRHAEEFAALIEENRVHLGLPRRPSFESAADLAAKIARSEERIRLWREKLEQATADEAMSQGS
jgi:hypothetical protein